MDSAYMSTTSTFVTQLILTDDLCFYIQVEPHQVQADSLCLSNRTTRIIFAPPPSSILHQRASHKAQHLSPNVFEQTILAKPTHSIIVLCLAID